MVANQKVTGKAVSFPAGVAIGLAISWSLTLIMAAMTAYLEGRGILGYDAVGYCLMLTLLLSSLAGALTAARKVKRIRFGVCMASALCYFLTLMVLTALFFGGQYSGIGVTGLVILGGAAAASFLGRSGKRSTSVRIKKYKNR